MPSFVTVALPSLLVSTVTHLTGKLTGFDHLDVPTKRLFSYACVSSLFPVLVKAQATFIWGQSPCILPLSHACLRSLEPLTHLTYYVTHPGGGRLGRKTNSSTLPLRCASLFSAAQLLAFPTVPLVWGVHIIEIVP